MSGHLAATLLERAARVVALHYSDFFGKAFEAFRKKYAKMSGTGWYFVQFTNHANDPLDRNPYGGKVQHSDPAGVYGYPLEYVTKYPADVWYGQGAKYLRVLELTSDKRLDLQSVTSSEAANMLARVGATSKDGQPIDRPGRAAEWMQACQKEFGRRLGRTGNKAAKVFFLCMQQRGPDAMDDLLSSTEQTARFRALGFDVLIDLAKNQKHAVINDREPEQVCFLTRYAFRVIETVNLHGAKDASVKNTFDPDELERPLAAQIATIMGDRLREGPERSSLGGWSYWWTAKGRRVETYIEQDEAYVRWAMDNLKWGEKPHKKHKIWTTHYAFVKAQTEYGEVSVRIASNQKLKDLLTRFKDYWEHAQTLPAVEGWEPETKASWQQKRADERAEHYRKQREEKEAKEAEFFQSTMVPMLVKVGAPAPDSGLDTTTVAGISDTLDTLHATTQAEGLDSADKVFNGLMSDELIDDSPAGEAGRARWKVIRQYVESVWPILVRSYHEHAETFKTDEGLRDEEGYWIGRTSSLRGWLHFLTGTHQ